jgi:hypothetical protein
MKYIKPFIKFCFVLALLSTSLESKSQILISLLFGDNLNSGNIEFGVDGGVNFAQLSGLDQSERDNFFNLGFYFDIKLKTQQPLIFHTGLMVKSNMGATGLPVYALDDPGLDAVLAGGTVDRRLSYFNAPAMLKYTFKNRIFMEAGPMFGLLYSATDNFSSTTNQGNDVSHSNNVRKKFHPLDAGICGGIGYRLIAKYGMNLAVRYYYGLVDIEISDSGNDIKNRSLYLAVGFPVGVGKAQAKAEAKELNQN